MSTILENGTSHQQHETRDDMHQYWELHSKKANAEEMMLDSNAEALGKAEIPEILSLLPDIKGKDVLELGAGIGRFTGPMASQAKSLVAIDFMESFVGKNKATNGHLDNVTILQADVTELNYPKNSFDVIFSNWLLMYLDDEEVTELMTKMLSWLRDDGYLFFRESCFHKSGNNDRDYNPTRYRSPAEYNTLYQTVCLDTDCGTETYGFDMVFSRSVRTYVEIKGNRNQMCWLVHKTLHSDHFGFKTFQEFLDSQQYSKNGILRYEKIFGRHFVSTGGKETTEEFVQMLDLKPGQSCLDVGAGIGGSAFYMAQNFGVNVLGIDLSDNMISIALERANELDCKSVLFEVGDATKREFSPESFDVVYSRDTILHIKDKLALFKNFLSWLKPGGKLLISDYCCKQGEWSDVYKAYVAQRGYHLLSVEQYGKVLEDAGFIKVNAMDKTDMFVEVLHREISKTKSIKEEFIKEFSEKDFNDIINGWGDKVHRCGLGDQKWGLFYAEKPL